MNFKFGSKVRFTVPETASASKEGIDFTNSTGSFGEIISEQGDYYLVKFKGFHPSYANIRNHDALILKSWLKLINSENINNHPLTKIFV